MVLIGYCLQEADRLGIPARRFIASPAGREAFAVGAAYQEFESVMDGLEDPVRGSGLFESLVSDLVNLSWQLDTKPESTVEEVIATGGLPREETVHMRIWIDSILPGAQTGNGRGDKLRRTLVMWERKIAERRMEMRRDFPRWDPDDTQEVVRIDEALARAWSGGRSWEWDRKIIAHTHCRACMKETVLVSEDKKHLGKRRNRLLELTKIKDIVDLNGAPLTV